MKSGCFHIKDYLVRLFSVHRIFTVLTYSHTIMMVNNWSYFYSVFFCSKFSTKLFVFTLKQIHCGILGSLFSSIIFRVVSNLMMKPQIWNHLKFKSFHWSCEGSNVFDLFQEKKFCECKQVLWLFHVVEALIIFSMTCRASVSVFCC